MAQTKPTNRNSLPDASNQPVLLVWSSPSTKGAGAYQLWENYRAPLSNIIPRVCVLRGHDEADSVANPQIKLNYRSVWWSLTKFRSILKRNNVTHVVTSISQADIIFGLIVRHFSKVHWTVYVLGQPYPVLGQTGRLKRSIWKQLWLIAGRRADRIIAVSDYIAGIISDGVPNADIRTAYPSILNANARPTSVVSSDVSLLRVGFVGRLSPEKDPLLFCSITNGLVEVSAKIYGDGPLRPEVDRLASDIEVMGFRSQEEIYSGIDVLMMTSKSEGLPMVLVEASFYGIIPLVADVGGCAEAIHPDNRQYLVVPRTDRDDIAVWRARLLLLADAELRNVLAMRQLDWARSKFDLAVNSRTLASLLVAEDGQ
ncbi:glycosyltransferase [Paenarthrobacter sp. AB444]|uniref:glycosyltransferase n=1 Tax=Paenarthrobacter sp. AB444 TaxID=3025681 RepID=UPI00236594FA|nr:glycosyltransferase [Paenarthrobacter sp. AB444]MDD7835647.1 glycosyltransferase [Paenarthrobacter sp. AB444]